MSGRGVADGQVLNPVDVEQHIRTLVDDVAHGVRVVSERHAAKVRADHTYDHAYAKAYLDAPGPQTEKRYHAELATAQERAARDVAEVAWAHAQRQLRALEGALSAWQTLSKSVQQMYGAAGRG